MEKLTYTHDAAAAAVIASVYPDAPPMAYVHSFGCQQNVNDGEKIRGVLQDVGFGLTDTLEQADLILFNTCAVREHAEQRVFGNVGALKQLKEKNPKLVIGVCGCMAQQPHIVEKLRRSYPYVDLVFGVDGIDRLPAMLAERFRRGKRYLEEPRARNAVVEDLPIRRDSGFRAWLPIMYGCDNFCTYCIVPYVRGRERSREPADILAEFRGLVAAGYKEITLLGQNVNSYGKTLDNPMSFAELLREVEKIDGLERIRFMTSHPKDLSDELIQVMAESKKICRHLHLPVQSGSTRILQKMNRRYTKEQYLELVRKIREAVPDISLTTDIIVGFPGETEEDFQDTLDVVRKVRYDSAFTFIYSRRTGTPAAVMGDQVDPAVVKDRFERLLKEVQDIAAQTCAVHQGTIQTALVESVNEHDSSLVTGRLSNNLLVHFPGDASLIGSLVPVSLKECRGFYYLGERA